MYGLIVDSLIAVIFYVAHFYERVFLTGLTSGTPFTMLNSSSAEDQQGALDFAAGIADMSGHDSIANTLRIAVDNMREKDNMRTFSKAIELLLSPELDHD